MAVQALGHYRILERIGSGGMGEVYRAFDERLEREVALKVLPAGLLADEAARKNFRKEALALARLNHPNIEAVYDFDTQDGTDFLVTEYVPGVTVAAKLAAGPLAADEILVLGAQLAEALAAAHAALVVHRDIKPANLRVTPDGRLKLLDFGLALLLQTEDEAKTGDVLGGKQAGWGTLPYMAPEQVLGAEPDPRGDIYSAGVVLYEMATGRRPFQEKLPPALVDAILRNPAPPPSRFNPDIPLRLEAIILRCLEKKPQHRYPSARDLLGDFRRAGVTETEKSLVVPYFENLSGAKEDEYFRDGITEDVITELSKVKPLRVFSRSAVFGFRDKPVPATEIGRQLAAAYVLAGSLRRAGNHLRITAQLVDTRTGHSIWADRYDRELKDVFDVQDDIARSISRALRITLSAQEERAIASKPTENPRAYDYYLRGRSYARRCTRPDLEFAIQMFEQAIALDSGFALAYAGLGIACGLLYDWHEKDPRWVEKALTASERALVLEPELPEGLAARARICWSQQRYQEAADFARRAIQHKPDCENAYWTLGQVFFTTDRWTDAAALAERAVEAAGADYNVYVPYMMALERLGQAEVALDLRQRHVQALERHLEEVPDDVRARILLANDYAFQGNAAGALREVQKAVELRPNDSNILYNAACTYGILNAKTEALAALRKAIDAGFDKLDYAARDPDLTCLYGDPEFARLVTSKQFA